MVFLIFLSLFSLSQFAYGVPEPPYTNFVNEPKKYPFYIGGDATFAVSEPHNDYTKLFRKTYWGGRGFLGYQFQVAQTPWCTPWCQDFAIELGLHWTSRKGQDNIFLPNDTLFELSNLSGARIYTVGKIQVRSTTLDLRYLQCCDCFKIVPFVGMGWARISPHVQTTSSASQFGRVLSQNFTTTRTDTGIIFRVGLGFERLLSERLGIRGHVVMETWNRLKTQAPEEHGFPDQVLGLSFSSTFGAFYIFGWF